MTNIVLPKKNPNVSPETTDNFTNGKKEGGWWKWIVLIGCFIINFIMEGTFNAFGVIYADLWSFFGGSKSRVSWIGSLYFSLPLIGGAVASLITVRFGCRFAAVMGGLIAALGMIASMFVNELEHLYLTFGVVSGLSSSLPYVASVLILSQYFDKRLGFVNGIAECGAGLGTVLLPILYELLLNSYGWRGTFMVMGGISLNIMVCGALFRSNKKKETMKLPTSAEQPVDPTYEKYRSEVEITYEEISEAVIGSCHEVQNPQLQKNASACIQNSENETSEIEELDQTKSNSLKGVISAAENLNDITLDFKNENNSTEKDNNLKEEPLPSAEITKKTSFCMTCTRSLGLGIFKNMDFTAYSVIIFVIYLWIDVPYVYLPDMAIEIGIGSQNAALLLSCLGVLQLGGNLLFGFFGDVKCVDNVVVFGVCVALSGASLALVPLVQEFWFLAICSGAFGFFTAAIESMCSVMLVDFLGLERLSTGCGYSMMTKGTSELIGPPIAGLLYDVSGSYDNTFYAAGGMLMVCGVLYTVLTKVLARVKRNKQKH